MSRGLFTPHRSPRNDDLEENLPATPYPADVLDRILQQQAELNKKVQEIEIFLHTFSREVVDDSEKVEVIRRAVTEIEEEKFPDIEREIKDVNDRVDEVQEEVNKLTTSIAQHSQTCEERRKRQQAFFENEVKRAVEKIIVAHEQAKQYAAEAVSSANAAIDIMNKMTTEPTSSPPAEKSENGIFITGIPILRQLVQRPTEDISDVIHNTLSAVGAAPYYLKIIAVHSKGQARKDSTQAIVYFQSTYHKRWALGELRKKMAATSTRGVGFRDLFDKDHIEQSKKLTHIGFHLRRCSQIQQFRVCNISGSPTLLTSGGGGRYSPIDTELLQRVTAEVGLSDNVGNESDDNEK